MNATIKHEHRIDEAAQKLRLMGNATRLRILQELAAGSCSVKVICERLGLPQATVSQHLAVLRSHDIVNAERHGAQVCYSLADGGTADILNVIR